ncbi:hypothetical protein [Cyclobacterium plantarum]|uniref:Uncharacterized protein n=1 Tax=Cyclobacterium plantarum TaxID=2716263 RepID=A0ABX0HDJ9_9BACT|nr:hypothetical protein [Cyclobacterium plantarum]NHE58481.1 hypothetical protein [Cyclobacterium plantarum]
MTGNVALDIFIGLVFVYLLYSLFATVILEIISTNLNIRGWNLRRSLYFMLNDKVKLGFPAQFWSDILTMFGRGSNYKKGGLAGKVYNSPGIGCRNTQGLISGAPSNITCQGFINALIYAMTSTSEDQKAQAIGIREYLESDIDNEESHNGKKHLLFLFNDANSDVDKFKLRLEQWYREMTTISSEWYKKRMQVWLFLIGFGLAYWFNLNTLYITKILSMNNKARDQMVQMAVAYQENNPEMDSTCQKQKELSLYYKEIQKQAREASDVLSLPKDLPEKIKIKNLKLSEEDFITRNDSLVSYVKEDSTYITFEQPKELQYLNIGPYLKTGNDGKLKTANGFAIFNKSRYFLCYQLWGYIITALGISLGAPFWFDLLNKLMQLRGAVSQKEPMRTETRESGTDKPDPV